MPPKNDEEMTMKVAVLSGLEPHLACRRDVPLMTMSLDGVLMTIHNDFLVLVALWKARVAPLIDATTVVTTTATTTLPVEGVSGYAGMHDSGCQ